MNEGKIPYLRKDRRIQFRAQQYISGFSTFQSLFIPNCRPKQLLKLDLILRRKERKTNYNSVNFPNGLPLGILAEVPICVDDAR
jgi:hypothetical protein